MPVGLPLQLYVDQETGLLLRLIRFTEAPLGKNPAQIVYADYRHTAGVEIAYQWPWRAERKLHGPH